jgi:hypothetical protein
MSRPSVSRGAGLRAAIFGASAVAVLTVHVAFARSKIPEASADLYERAGVGLQLKGPWLYGYVAGMHGAYLVKVPRPPSAPKTARRSGRPEITAIMARELDLVPAKVAGEAALYIAMLAYLFFGTRVVRRALERFGSSRMARWIRFFGPGAILFVIVAAPLLVFGYGYGGFTNLAGPGAMSYSGPYYDWTLWRYLSGNTISYRAFISLALAPVGFLVQLTTLAWNAVTRFDEDLEQLFLVSAYWFVGVLLYGTAFGLWNRYARRAPTAPGGG